MDTGRVPSTNHNLAHSTEPQDEESFERALENAKAKLKNDFSSGAKELADEALRQLGALIYLAGQTTRDRQDLWDASVAAAAQLCSARPSMNAAITSVLLRGLQRLRELWDAMPPTATVTELANTARTLLAEHMPRGREDLARQVGSAFVEWVYTNAATLLPPIEDENQGAQTLPLRTLRILTLSNSSTIRAAVHVAMGHAHTAMGMLDLHIDILESRPRCEGAAMAARMLAETAVEKTRLHVRILPDCAVATAAREADVVLLGADRITATGDVVNKMGSLAAAVCAKQFKAGSDFAGVLRRPVVVVLSDTDKIAAPGMDGSKERDEGTEDHPVEEMVGAWDRGTLDALEKEKRKRKGEEAVEVFGEWFEWVSAEFVDVYVTDKGVMGRGKVAEWAGEMGRLREEIFGRYAGTREADEGG